MFKEKSEVKSVKDVKYNDDNFFFLYRVSALIFNKDKTKILLFYGNDMDYYMLPGGKVHQLEKSEDAIKREIIEELGLKDLKFDLIGISEEIVKDKENDIQQITLTYKCIYEDEIRKESLKSIESDWINFKWVDINKLDNYKIHPSNIKTMIKNSNSINHLIEIGEYMNDEYLIKIDEPRIQETCDAYFKWKDLNTYVKSLVSRGINMPDAISEPMGCYCLNLLWNKSSGGDAKSLDGKKIEFKATSNYEYDLSSFGPKCDFDDLVFLRFDLDLNMLFVYDTGVNSEELKKIPVSKTATVGDYQKAGKRPHIRIIESIINAKKLEPTVIFNIRRGMIVEKV